jgi:hypothetical protein
MATFDGVHGTVCNPEQYQQSLTSQDNPIPSISCLTQGQTIGLTVRIQPRPPFLELIPRTDGSRSIVVESFIRERHIYLDCCKSESLHVYVFVDKTLHSGIDDGTRKMSQGVIGTCLRGLLMSIWSA